MDAKQAVEILGLNHNPKGVCERNMITALQTHLWMNTLAETERLRSCSMGARPPQDVPTTSRSPDARSIAKENSLRFRLTRVSTNRKTGPIPVATSSSDTCPTTCPLLTGGCYGKGGPLRLVGKASTKRASISQPS